MTIKPAYEELEQRITELGAKSEKRKTVRTRKNTDLYKKATEFI